MTLRRLTPLLAFVVAVALAPRASCEPSTTKVRLEPDITFRKVGDKEMKLDIALPAGKGPHPAILCVHGGAWRMGSRNELRDWIEYLAEKGYVAASTSYRLVPDGKWPDPIEDCKTAVRFLRANAEKYQIDSDHVGALGYSAGGHLVCLLGTTDSKQGFDGPDYPGQSSKVQAVVSYFGPTDLCYWGTDESAQNAIFQPMLGCRFKDNPAAYEKASPICYACKSAPPFLFFHGTADRLVPIDQSRKLASKLREAGVSARVVEVKDGDHGWGGKDARQSTAETLKFFAEHLKRPKAKPPEAP